MTIDEICARYGIKAATWRSYVARSQAPKPTGYDQTTGKRVWDADQVQHWASHRPGQGHRGQTPWKAG